MYFKQFLHDDTGCASYFIASRQSREAVVVDPQYDIRPYLDLAIERGYQITHVVDTHLHADHLSGNRRLAAATDGQLWLHESAEVRFRFRRLADGDELHIGQLILRVVHTPGHRPEAISLLAINPQRSPEPSMVLGGDTLFVGDVGRPDFGGPDGAQLQYTSTRRLLELPDWVEVFPAHFEGSCGKHMCCRPSTTIGFERRFNLMLLLSESEFVRETEAPTARPLNMSAILAANQGMGDDYTWPQVTDKAEIPSVKASAALHWIEEHAATVVDVREPLEYAATHIPWSVLIPQAELALQLELLPTDTELLLVCRSGARSLRSAQFLKASGYHRVTNLDGGMIGWMEAGHPIATGQSVASADIRVLATP
jgi:hydroxyacylglutathione hydrolase